MVQRGAELNYNVLAPEQRGYRGYGINTFRVKRTAFTQLSLS